MRDRVRDRPALRYYGSKWILAPWIIEQFGQHEVFVEVFGGSAAVLLRKERSAIEIYNDLDAEVVNFFYVLREWPDMLLHVLSYTPFSLAEFNLAQEFDWQSVLENCSLSLPGACGSDSVRLKKDVKEIDIRVEAARLFYVRSMQGIAGPTAKWKSGFRRQKVFSRGKSGEKTMTPAARTWMKQSHLTGLSRRLQGVCIEELDAIECIEKYDSPETLFYLDPPYVQSTRCRWRAAGYRHEMTDETHEYLLARVKQLRGQVVISGYRCELYDDELASWRRLDREARINGQGSAVESLWINEAAVDAREGYKNLPLFKL